VAAWVQALFEEDDEPPILVGGAAIEIYTRGGYVTGDLDFVGVVSPRAAKALAAAGFERRGRHWILDRAQLFLEFPGRRLAPSAPPRRLRAFGSSLAIISPEALLADRLAAWKFWRSTTDAANALLLVQRAGTRMNARLAARLARELEVEDERRRLVRFARRLRGRRPTTDQMERWLAAAPAR
jgi:hypothetical protein